MTAAAPPGSLNAPSRASRDRGVPWRLFWRMVWYRPWLYALTTLLAIAGTVLFVVPGVAARAFFDTLAGNAPEWSTGRGIAGLIGLLLGAQIGRMGLFVFTILVDLTVRHSLHGLLRKNVMRRLLRVPAGVALPVSPGEAISRLRDDAGELALFLAWIGLLNVVGLAAFAIVALAIMLRIDAALTLVVFVPLVAVVAIAPAAGSRVEHYRQASRQASGRVASFLGELFGAVLAVQVAGAEERMVAQLQTRNAARQHHVLRDRLFGEALQSIFFGSVHLGTGAILLLAGSAMRAGTFTVGDFALFAYVLTWVSALTQSVGSLLARYEQSRVAFGRLADLQHGALVDTLVTPVPIHLHRPAPEVPFVPKTGIHRLHTLRATGLTYRFPGSRRGIVDVDLYLERGTFTVITGRVGAGKSTLLRVLLGVLPKDSGQIWWNGQLMDEPTAFFVPPRCAYTPQVPRLFSASLRENLLLGIPERAADLHRALYLAVLERDVAAMEQGLDTVVGPRGLRLSGGQIQSCWSSTTSPARWTWQPNTSSGSGCLPAVSPLGRHRGPARNQARNHPR
jgi:ATP-binding cassette, subfamily B, bacterial